MNRNISRRGFMRAGGLGALTLAGLTTLASCTPRPPSYIMAGDHEVLAREAERLTSGSTVAHRFIAEKGFLELEPGKQLQTWGYQEYEPLAALGPTIRVNRGDRLVVAVENRLPEETSLHWHGLRIRNDMDGAPPDTQEPIQPGGEFTYDFTVPDHGTYWYHSHTGLQADRSLFGAVIVEDPDDRSGADTDHVLVLDDWLMATTTPEEVLAALGADPSHGHDHGGMQEGSSFATPAALELTTKGMGSSTVLGGPTQHLAYQQHLVNGRGLHDPERWHTVAGSRVRLRVINAAAETPYRVALAGHRLTVAATDGFDTRPYETDSVLIAPAQRVDLLIDLASGVWPFVAKVEGREGAGLAVLATHDAVGETPRGDDALLIDELGGQLATDRDLFPAASAELPERTPDQTWRLELIEAEGTYVWGIAGQDVASMRPRMGERIRIEMHNTSSMWHPMHLHGHTFASRAHNGLRRDTEIVLPGETAVLDFDADNPGRWMIHCHNAYHFIAGMSAPIRYVR